MTKYSSISEIEFCLEKRFANSIENALNVDDVYITLSQCADIEKGDIDRKIQETISKMP